MIQGKNDLWKHIIKLSGDYIIHPQTGILKSENDITKRITGETKTVVGWPSHHWVNPWYGFSKSCKYFRDINNSFCKMLC